MKTLAGTVELILHVNGEERRTAVRPGETLLRVLREQLGLTGAKCGCENGDCGACTVLLDGRPVKSCMVLAVECDDTAITTIEGLRDHPVQKAFAEENGFQCGFCTPGQILNAAALLDAHPEPDEAADREWMQSNLCRCTGYEGIR
ncbi:MAG: (2Fe-2S)-binding protein, partial [Opitutae bacterium]|nr:(2Fe-2S)-binding protein [Opitutae bacterium]